MPRQDADDAWAAPSRSSPRGKPSPNVPNRRPRFPTSTPPPGPSTHPSGFPVRSQQDSALAFGSAIPSVFRPRPSKQSFSAATHRFQPNGLHGSRSYPRRHGVQFRRAHILYHSFRCDSATKTTPFPQAPCPLHRRHDVRHDGREGRQAVVRHP